MFIRQAVTDMGFAALVIQFLKWTGNAKNWLISNQ